jgi:hypothetical protein
MIMDDYEVSGLTVAKVNVYKTTAPLLRAMQDELKELAKKKPEATLSKTKVAFINRLLVDLKELFGDEPTSKYLDVLNDEDLPQYSDVVLVMSQYRGALDAFRKAHTDGLGKWVVSDEAEMAEEEDSEDSDGADEDSEDAEND